MKCKSNAEYNYYFILVDVVAGSIWKDLSICSESIDLQSLRRYLAQVILRYNYN